MNVFTSDVNPYILVRESLLVLSFHLFVPKTTPTSWAIFSIIFHYKCSVTFSESGNIAVKVYTQNIQANICIRGESGFVRCQKLSNAINMKDN